MSFKNNPSPKTEIAMASSTAHILGKTWRSSDIQIDEDINFSGLLLSDKVLNGLTFSGFVRPSPIQLQAIPLGRTGLDLIVQAKSGTGKTCVFAVVALEKLLLESKATQVLVLAPTREVAVQICQVVRAVGAGFKGLQCHAFIGGMPLQEDKIRLRKCHIAVGTPGRIKQLIKQDLLKTNSVRLFVLDEADKLMEESFQESINWIFSSLPIRKQMLALSATYPEELASLLQLYMTSPSLVRLNADRPALIGVTQYYTSTPYHPMQHTRFQSKIEVLVKILNRISFSQCLVFSNFQTRAESLCDELRKRGWPTDYISGSQEQGQRLQAIDKLKDFKCRVLVSTDVTSRGIDAENVNLIVNMDVPWEVETYLHRIGRAGRFGSRGLAVTLISGEEETELFGQLKEKGHLNATVFPDPMPDDIWKHQPKDVLFKLSLNCMPESIEEKGNENTDFEQNSSAASQPSDKPSLGILSDLLNQKSRNDCSDKIELGDFKPNLTWIPQNSSISSFSYDQLMHDFDSSLQFLNREENVLEDEQFNNEETQMLSHLNSFLIGNHEEFRIKLEDGFDVCGEPAVHPESVNDMEGIVKLGHNENTEICHERTLFDNTCSKNSEECLQDVESHNDILEKFNVNNLSINHSNFEVSSNETDRIIGEIRNKSVMIDMRNTENHIQSTYSGGDLIQEFLFDSSTEQSISNTSINVSKLGAISQTDKFESDNISVIKTSLYLDNRLEPGKNKIWKYNYPTENPDNVQKFSESLRNVSKCEDIESKVSNVIYYEDLRSEKSLTRESGSDSSVGSDDSGCSQSESEDSESESSEENYFRDQESTRTKSILNCNEQFYDWSTNFKRTLNSLSGASQPLCESCMQHWWKPNSRMSADYEQYNHYMIHMLSKWLRP